jgi:hypothetical protein
LRYPVTGVPPCLDTSLAPCLVLVFSKAPRNHHKALRRRLLHTVRVLRAQGREELSSSGTSEAQSYSTPIPYCSTKRRLLCLQAGYGVIGCGWTYGVRSRRRLSAMCEASTPRGIGDPGHAHSKQGAEAKRSRSHWRSAHVDHENTGI